MAKILLAEDDDSMRHFLRRALERAGHDVFAVGQGTEAIPVLAEGRFDLLLADIVMPEMDGPTLLKEMRSRNAELKIIFVSGYAEDAFEKSLPENQQFAFLPKPFTLTQLVAAVKETMTGN